VTAREKALAEIGQKILAAYDCAKANDIRPLGAACGVCMSAVAPALRHALALPVRSASVAHHNGTLEALAQRFGDLAGTLDHVARHGRLTESTARAARVCAALARDGAGTLRKLVLDNPDVNV